LRSGYGPAQAHGQNFQALISQTEADLHSPDKEVSIAATDPESISLFSTGRSISNVTASIAITRKIDLYGTWQEGSHSGGLTSAESANSYNTDQKEIVFEWRIRQVKFEALYNLYKFSNGSDTQSFSKAVMVKVTRYFNLF
jgi:hypothetical protein